MSAVDEALFAPIDEDSEHPWRTQCRQLVAALEKMRAARRQRPPGAMLLEDLLERFYVHGQTTFWVVDPVDGKFDFEFNGEVYLSENGYVGLCEADGHPVIDWNLYPNDDHSSAYTFWDEDDADAYEDRLF